MIIAAIQSKSISGDARINHVFDFLWSNQFHDKDITRDAYMKVTNSRPSRYVVDLGKMPSQHLIECINYLELE